MSATSFSATSEERTHALARQLAGLCHAGDCVLLLGDLGAGKTSFSRAFIQSLQQEPEEVLSPTFSLVQTYAARGGYSIYHFDLYRLKSPVDLVEIGFDDALMHGLTLVEWPQIAADHVPKAALTVQIEIQGDGARSITLSGENASWQERLLKLQAV